MKERMTFTETLKDSTIRIEVVVYGFIEETFTIKELPDLSERFSIQKGTEPIPDIFYINIESAIKAVKSYAKRNY